MPTKSRSEIMDFYLNRGREKRAISVVTFMRAQRKAQEQSRAAIGRGWEQLKHSPERAAEFARGDKKHDQAARFGRALQQFTPLNPRGRAPELLSKTASAVLIGDAMQGFWSGFTKNADVSKEELRTELKKHEARETPAQEKAESAKEQEIERRAGVEKKAFFTGFEKDAGLGVTSAIGAGVGAVGNVLRGSGPNGERGGVVRRALTGAAVGGGLAAGGHMLGSAMARRAPPQGLLPAPRPAPVTPIVHAGALPAGIKQAATFSLGKDPRHQARIQDLVRRLVRRSKR